MRGGGKDMVRCADQSYIVGFADGLWLSLGKDGFEIVDRQPGGRASPAGEAPERSEGEGGQSIRRIDDCERTRWKAELSRELCFMASPRGRFYCGEP